MGQNSSIKNYTYVDQDVEISGQVKVIKQG